MWRSLPLLIVLIACPRNPTTPEPAPDDAAPTVDLVGTVDGGDVVADATDAPPQRTPAELYAECHDRVEGRSADGECTTDADCVAAGCSTETCITAEAAKGFMSTCEIKPCFAILDTCGCVEGQCSWSIKDTVPARNPLKPATTLPTTLPNTPPADAPATEAPSDDAPAQEAPTAEPPAEGGE